jgi:large subunit ribosomal protein L3
MTVCIIGRKRGMTRVFHDSGVTDAVTVVEIERNAVVQLKTEEVDGYRAVQLAIGDKKNNTKRRSRVSKSIINHYKKANVELGKCLREVRLDSNELVDIAVGDSMNADLLKGVKSVDVTGISKGKGFAGVIKRHNFTMQDATHGNSLSHRAAGSIGQCQTPGRVFKGKKMAGHMGSENKTVRNLKIVDIDLEKNLVFIKGAVPGMPGGLVKIKASNWDKTQIDDGSEG